MTKNNKLNPIKFIIMNFSYVIRVDYRMFRIEKEVCGIYS